MKCFGLFAFALVLITNVTLSKTANAQSTEERFQDVFVTAGYATAFGAALGAACLSFMDEPQAHLQYVAVGASLGFIGGSLLGTYVVLSPTIATGPVHGSTLAATASSENRVIVRPVFDRKHGGLAQVETAFTLWSF